MKYHNVNNVPGNYEGMYNERVRNQSRDTREIINSFTPNQIYKPFSNTIKVPPIEDPIILNPNYKNILAYNEINNDDFELRRKELAVKVIVERLKYVQSRDNKNSLYTNKYTQKNETKRNKLQNIETAEMHKNKVLEWEDKRESKKDLQTIKMTALNIIDENIKKAVSVAEQIKQEIDVEMTGKQQERRELTETKESYEKISKKKECVQKSLQKQSFSLGKQTIPYMKFYMQSNNFNTMLIKRIFLQLTNFMVSLTKYLSRNSNIFHTSRKSLDYNSFNGEIGDLEGEYEDLILSGAEMSRKFGKTPLEFTKRMDTVIMEFEKRTGIEHNMTIRRSRSRSRSTVKDKLVNGDFIDNRKENIDGKNTYRAFVTEEWSEYYDLRQPEMNKTLKSEKYMESETIKKETIEKLVEEKIQKEFPVTYIAIVQAHVFTNQDAIIRDTQEDKCEQHTTTDTLHSKKESLIQEREQNALYTDLEYQLIRINKEQPVEKEVVVESIEDITPVEEYKMFPALEQVKTGVAVQKTTELLEPIMEIEIEKQKNILKARPTIQPSNISIASIEPVVLQEDKDDSFILPEIKHRKSITLFEEPFKSIAEKTNIETFEPRVEIININENALAKPISSFEAPSTSIAQVSQVELIEPQSRPLKLEMPIEGRSKELVQTPIQSVAVNIETITESPKIDFICALQPKTATSNILVESLSTTVAKKSEVYIDETTVSLDTTELNHTHVNQAIVPPLQLVAQKLETNLDESCANFNNRKMKTEPFQQMFEQPLKVVAQTLETSTDVANLSIFKTDSVLSENSKTYLEVPCQTVAQVGEIYSETAAALFEGHKNNEENIKVSVETPNKSIAEKLEISEEEVIQPYLSKHRLEKIKKSMEPGKYVAEKYDIQMNDIGEEFYEFKAKTTEPEITIETPIWLTAETNVTLSDEAMGFVEKNKNLLETIKPHSVPAFKPVAEVSLTVTNETSGIYEKSKLEARNSLFQIEAPIGTVAEISEPRLHELSEIFDKKLKLNSTEKPNTSVEITFKTVPEISEVILSDFSENITMPVTNSDKTKIVLEIPVKTVAEKSETYVDKLEIQTFQSNQINTEMPSSTIETPIQTVAEKSIITADEPKPYNLEIDTFKKKSPKLLMEESQRFIPEIEVLILEGPKLESFDMPKIHEVEANIAVDKLEPTTITQILLAEPSQIPFDVPQVQIKVPRPLIEEPLLTVPEVSMLSLEGPKDGILVVSKSSEAHACLALQNSDAASVFETAILEPQCDLLETPQIKERQHHRSIEEIKLTVSDIQENVILGPKDDVLLTPLIVKTNASLNIDEQKALEGSLIISAENIEKHPDLKIDIRQPKIFVEECTKRVAENVQIRTAESEKSLCVVSDAIEKVADITVQSVQSVAKIDQIIALSSVTDENFHTSQDTKKIESKVESFETLKATINEIDVRESKVEITEVIDDKFEEVAVNYKAKDETKEIMSTNNKKVLELDGDFIKKDIESMENGMSSIIQSVDKRVISKSSKKSTLVTSEVKLSESESSKSPSPTSPINDVYFFCVETPYSRHEPEAETAIVELDFKSTPKRRYTQAEISVAQSIGITYEVSDSEDEVEIIEVDYEKHQYESDINMGAVITERNIESRKERQFSENAIEDHQHNEVSGVMQFKNKSAIIDTQSRIEKSPKSQASLETSRQDITETIQHQAHQLSSKRKSAKSKEQSSKSYQKREALHTESQEGSIEISGSFQTQVTQSEIQSVEQNRQDIKVIEKEFESRHALLEHDITSKQLESKEKLAIKQIEHGLHEQVTVDSQELKSPPIEPATPLTDEYVFRLTAPFPPSREGTPVPRDCTSSSSSESEEEIRRKLIPHMDLSIEQRIYDPPLPTPPTSPPVTSPVTSVTSSSRSKPLYSKPGLRGGGDTFDLTKEDVLEIGRQSNLLASAIDKTIKRIEEYKSQAGIMEYASSEISSSESRTVNEYRCEDSKVEVLIDKMVETSRRLSGDVEDSGNSKEVIIPIVQDAATEEAHETSEDTTNYASKEERKMETSKLSEQLLNSVQGMVDPNASLEERLKQMNSQIDELSKLPDLIQKTLNEVKVQFEQLNYQLQQKSSESQTCQIENSEQVQTLEKVKETPQEQPTIEITAKDVQETIEEIPEPDTEIQNIIDKRRLEAESKTRDEIMKERLSQELRIAAERLSPKLGLEDKSKMPEHRPYMSFSPLPQTTPAEVSPMGVPPSVSLPMSVPPKSIVPQGTPTAPAGETARPGKVWKKSDNYDNANLEQMLSETLAAQAEVIKGKAIGVNFMKYEKPPPALDHLQNSEVYKAIHEMDQKPLKKVELLKPAIAASDYVERLRSASPTPAKTLIEDCEV